MGPPSGNGKKFKDKIWPRLLTSKSREDHLGSRVIHVWSIIIVCQNEMELSSKNGKTNCKKFKVQIWPWILTPNRERSFSGLGQYICEVSLLYAKNKWIYHVETIKSVKTKYDLVLWSFDAKNPYRSFSDRHEYICEVSILYAKSKWSCDAETVKKFKVQIWPLTFWPKINRGPPQVKVNIYVKYHHCMSNGRGVIVQKPLFHRRTDRWTDSYGEPSIPPQLRWRGYPNLFSMWRNRWKMTPLEVKISWGSHFFTICGSKFYVKIWTVSAFNVEKWPGESLLPLKNDPGVIFQRGHYLMLHRNQNKTVC